MALANKYGTTFFVFWRFVLWNKINWEQFLYFEWKLLKYKWQGYPLIRYSFKPYLPKNCFEHLAKIEENSRKCWGIYFKKMKEDKTGRIWWYVWYDVRVSIVKNKGMQVTFTGEYLGWNWIRYVEFAYQCALPSQQVTEFNKISCEIEYGASAFLVNLSAVLEVGEPNTVCVWGGLDLIWVDVCVCNTIKSIGVVHEPYQIGSR